MPKSATLSGIKSLYCYTIREAAEVSGVSDRTIRSWIKNGLPVMMRDGPALIRGDALIFFIKAQRKARKINIGRDEFYCLKCRAARKPAGGMVERETNGARSKLIAICEVCETMMHKPVAQAQVQKLAEVFDLTNRDRTKVAQILVAE